MGLLLMRLAAGIAVIIHALPLEPLIPNLLVITAGILLAAGLWTPASSSLVAVWGLWNAISQQGDPWYHILLASLGAALAMVGPGTWSIDARLFGWKRIDVGDR